MSNETMRAEDLFNDNFDEMERGLEAITEGKLLKIEIDRNLEDAITELNSLKEQYNQKDSTTLLQLCKENVLKTIVSQFGLTTLKTSTDLASKGGAQASFAAAFSALGIVLRDLATGILEEIRLTFEQWGTESFKEIFSRFKIRLQQILADLKNKWKDILKGSFESALLSFLSSVVVFVINLFFTTIKKIVAMIREGFVSFCRAIKLLTNPPADMPKEDVHYEAVKILTAGLIGAAAIGLSAAIEKGLQAIPGLQPLMLFPIPTLIGEPRTVSDILAVTLSSLAGGVLASIVLYFMDKCRNQAKHDKLQIQLVNQSGVVVHCQIAGTWCAMDDAYNFFKTKVVETAEMFNETEQRLEQSFQAVKAASASREDIMAQLRARFNK